MNPTLSDVKAWKRKREFVVGYNIYIAMQYQGSQECFVNVYF